jgi:tetratricopeptide (TPR) repeat protein
MNRTVRLPGCEIPLSDLIICIGLVVAILAVYAQVVQFDFISADDDLYVAQNPIVQAGLSRAGIAWAATAVVANNWLPVTLLSHMADMQIFGISSGAHHLMNIVYHALAAVILFVVLRRSTKELWPSAFVAALFALHPLHVESVAWISERKDVLSALFCFLALYAYVRYVERPGFWRYLPVLAFFALGLMSKPMLVTLPFALFLFDLWPLRRPAALGLLWEKVPLFALSAAVSAATYWAQHSTGAVAEAIHLDTRVAKAVLSYVTYLWQTFWPAALVVYYPYPRYLPALRVAGAFLLLVGISAMAIRNARSRPYLAVGWFWYLGTMVPVIGLVQVSWQSHADRYTYIPMIGLSIMLAWGFAEVARNRPQTKSAIASLGVICCVASAALAARQAGYWRNVETLCQHALDVDANNWWAHSNLGAYLTNFPERRADALDHLQTALRINPNDAAANNNLGTCMLKSDLGDAAIPYFEAAMRLRPDLPGPHFNLASVLANDRGREAEAISHFEAGLRLRPYDPEAHRRLGLLLADVGRKKDALAHLEASQRLRPDSETAEAIERLRAASLN